MTGRLLGTLLLLFLLVLPCGASGFDPAARTVLQKQADDQAAIQQVLQVHQAEQARLEAEQERVTEALKQQQSALAQRQEELQQLQQQSNEVALALARDEADLKALEESIQSAARDGLRLLQQDPQNWQAEGPLAAVEALADQTTFPQLQQIRMLSNGLLEQIERGRGPVRIEMLVVNPSGQSVPAPVILRPPLAPLAQTPQGARFLRTSAKEARLHLINPGLSRSAQGQLNRFVAGEAGLVPVDLTLGRILQQAKGAPGLWQRVLRGGLVVWPILLIGLLASLLVLERLLHLSRLRADTGLLRRQVLPVLDEGDMDGCKAVCKQHGRNPAARVLEAGLAHSGQSLETVENAFHEAMLHQIPKLERFLPTLSVLAAVAPLLGLLGTVSGMIGTFQALTLSGASQSGLLSGGISEALITTQLGLAVAIPILLIHHFLERRVEVIVDRMESIAVTFTPSLARQDSSV